MNVTMLIAALVFSMAVAQCPAADAPAPLVMR
jgi:hypothetical protein